MSDEQKYPIGTWYGIDCMGCEIPRAVEAAIRNYVCYGLEPGHFVRAVLENDLQRAVGCADPQSFQYLKQTAGHVYSCIPGTAWGSREKVEFFLKMKEEEIGDREVLG